ncbi:MAG: hypothetical protein MJZ62_07285 [Bacteroidales bacterium]|nr:hypothetical protein [Bacteroidales bacterium]
MGDKIYNFYDGAQNVEHIDTQIININLPGNKSVNKEQSTNEIRPFEDAIPESLRIGKLYNVWVNLKKEGILDENYRLAPGIPHTAANYLVTCFCTEGNCKWKPFEQFWGIDKLKDKKGEFRIDLKDKINSIFAKH